MTIQQRQQKIVNDLGRFTGWMERYKRIIEMGRALPALSDELKTEKNRVKGCQSQVWLVASFKDGLVVYQADSDALIVRGLAAILLNVFSGSPPDEIMNAGVDFLTELGLTTHLSQSRANGLVSMIKQFKNYAIAFKVMEEGSKVKAQSSKVKV